MRKIPWSPPDIGEEEIEEAKEVLDSTWLTQGKKTEEFEREIKKYIGCKNAVVVNNGTSALIAALLAHGIGRGDEVVVPTYTFIATVNSILSVGAKPVLVDCDKGTFNTTPEMMEEAISKHTRAIMPVDVAGMPVEVKKFKELAEDKDIILIEDAAEAIGAEYKNNKIGSFGHTSIFSFHMAKLASSVEGGCIVTNDDKIAEKFRQIRNHGMRGKYEHVEFGLNLRTTDINSAIGLTQMRKLDKYLNLRNSLANIYMEELEGLVEFQEIPEYVTLHPYMLFGVLTEKYKRNDMITFLNNKGIGTRICWPPAHLQPYYRNLFKGKFPNSENLASRIINLPMGNALTEDDVSYTCKVLKEAMEDR